MKIAWTVETDSVLKKPGRKQKKGKGKEKGLGRKGEGRKLPYLSKKILAVPLSHQGLIPLRDPSIY